MSLQLCLYTPCLCRHTAFNPWPCVSSSSFIAAAVGFSFCHDLASLPLPFVRTFQSNIAFIFESWAIHLRTDDTLAVAMVLSYRHSPLRVFLSQWLALPPFSRIGPSVHPHTDRPRRRRRRRRGGNHCGICGPPSPRGDAQALPARSVDCRRVAGAVAGRDLFCQNGLGGHRGPWAREAAATVAAEEFPVPG